LHAPARSTRRSIRRAALLATVSLALVACGDDGPSPLSEDDFLDELADICADAQREFDRIDPPVELADYEDAAEESLVVLREAKLSLARLVPPEDFARDFQQFRRLVDEEIEQFTALQEAAADEDEADVEEAIEEISASYEEQAELAEDLESEDCSPDLGDTPPDGTSTTVAGQPSDPTATPASTDAPGSSAAPATSAPSLPTIPVTTAPITPATAPPVSTAAPTAPPVDGGEIEIDSVTSSFAAPAGYTMTDTADDITRGVVAGFSADPVLGSALDLVGLADLIEPSGITVARLFIAYTREDAGAMPPDWNGYFCGDLGAPATTPDGFNGVTCSLDDGEGGTQNFFSLIGGQAGFAVLSVDPNLDLAAIVDAFFVANPGSD